MTNHVPLSGRLQLASAAARLNNAHADPGPVPVDATAEPMLTPPSVSRRADALHLTDSDYRFLVGWLVASSPVEMDDALNALVIFREYKETDRA